MFSTITYVTTVDAVKGAIIKRVRKSKYLTQKQLALRLDISLHTLSNIEAGKIAATQQVIGKALNGALGIDQLTFDTAVAEAIEGLVKRDVLVVACYISDILRMRGLGHAIALENESTIDQVINSLYIYGVWAS